MKSDVDDDADGMSKNTHTLYVYISEKANQTAHCKHPKSMLKMFLPLMKDNNIISSQNLPKSFITLFHQVCFLTVYHDEESN